MSRTSDRRFEEAALEIIGYAAVASLFGSWPMVEDEIIARLKAAEERGFVQGLGERKRISKRKVRRRA